MSLGFTDTETIIFGSCHCRRAVCVLDVSEAFELHFAPS